MKTYVVYILTNASRRTLYTGISSRIGLRAFQHKHKVHNGFTAKYNVHRWVYYERYSDAWSAIAREKQIKGWLRGKKIALIESVNPRWDDQTGNWESLFQPVQTPGHSLENPGPSLGPSRLAPARQHRACWGPRKRRGPALAQDDFFSIVLRFLADVILSERARPFDVAQGKLWRVSRRTPYSKDVARVRTDEVTTNDGG